MSESPDAPPSASKTSDLQDVKRTGVRDSMQDYYRELFPTGFRLESEHQRVQWELEKLLPHIRFRLTGWQGAEQIDLKSDIKNTIQVVERPLITDPIELQKRLNALRDPLTDHVALQKARFVEKGEHVYLAPLKKLIHERERGVQVVANFIRKDQTEKPIGYCHGFETIPHKENQFASLDAATLVPAISKIVLGQRHQWAAIWRTGVSEEMVLDAVDVETLRELGVRLDGVEEGKSIPLRRLGIGTALKYVMIHILALRGKQRATLNVGTIVDECNPNTVLPNASSTIYNTNIFRDDLGYRQHYDKIGETGMVLWHAYAGNTQFMLRERLEGPRSSLRKHGWNYDRLKNDADTMFRQILIEIDQGKHVA